MIARFQREKRNRSVVKIKLHAARLPKMHFASKNDSSKSDWKNGRLSPVFGTMPKRPPLSPLPAFVAEFVEIFARREQREACVAYLQCLLTRQPAGSRSIGAAAPFPHKLRQFVNRSSWSADDLMKQIRMQVLQNTAHQKGVLTLLSLKLSKQGKQSVGVTRRHRQDLVTWCWVSEGRVWPLAARLHVLYDWSAAGWKYDREWPRPTSFEDYADVGRIALALLDEMLGELPASRRHVVIDETFAQHWPIFGALERRGFRCVVRLRMDDLWPEERQGWSKPRAWNEDLPYDRLMSFRYWFPWHFEIARLARSSLPKRRFILRQIQPSSNPQWSELTGASRHVCWNGLPNGYPGFYLLSKDEWTKEQIVERTGELGLSLTWAEKMMHTYGLRRFEGRSWKGFHHHVALCLMAYLFRSRA